MIDFVMGMGANKKKFIKVIAWNTDKGGWVEIARLKLSKNEWVENNFDIQGDIFNLIKTVGFDAERKRYKRE